MKFIDVLMIMMISIKLIISVLISVAFLTLLERKVLGYIQLRKGPNKLSYKGLLQPMSDGIKLFMKEQLFLFKSNMIPFLISPMINFLMSLILWMMMPYWINFINFNLGMMFFLCCLTMSIYMTMIMGWSSNSNYALLGSIRSMAQTISYEISFALILMSIIIMIKSFNFMMLEMYQQYMWFLYLMLPLMMMWYSSSLVETNRTPFDLTEGESELVSGFNIEYSSSLFAFIFLAEYSNIIFMSMINIILFMNNNIFYLTFYIKIMIISSLFLLIRGTYLRYRYDQLMYLIWKCYLLFALNFLILYLSLLFLLN